MRRQISFIISALLFSGLLAALLHPRSHPPAQSGSSASLPPARLSLWQRLFQPDLRPEPDPALPQPRLLQTQSGSLPEVRVAALRGLNNYGWIQLPRGTPVELLRTEGEYLIIRYDETVMRIHRRIAEAGLVVPRPARLARL